MPTNKEEFRAYWDEKFQSYIALIGDLEEKVREAKKQMPAGPYAALLDLITKLKNFAEDQFKLFLDGFAEGLFEQSTQEPKEYMLQKILEQIGNDLTVIEQIADDWDGGTNKRQPMKQGTVFAENALQLAYLNGFLTEPVKPFIYLHKTPVIRVIPYAQAALIGIPYTAVNNNQRNGSNFRGLLAIPHEVGHYVYWNGVYTNQETGESEQIKAYLEKKLIETGLSRYAHWLEEIFSDVYSAFVGGTVTAHSIQEILLDNNPIFFDLDDGLHPPNTIRPYIYAYALAGNKTISEAIISAWEQTLSDRGIAQSFKRALIIRDSNDSIQSLTFEKIDFGDNVILDGRKIIQALLKIVADIFDNKNLEKRWGKNKLGREALDEVSTKINGELNIARFREDVQHWKLEFPKAHEDLKKERQNLRDLINKGTIKIPPENWRKVYRAAEWASGGEEDGYRTIE